MTGLFVSDSSSWTTISIFILSIVYFKSQQTKRANRLQSPFEQNAIYDEENNDDQRENKESSPWNLSRRGQIASNAQPIPPPSSLSTPRHNYWSAFLTALSDPYHVTHNPQGWIALCLAEQKLSSVVERLALRLMEPGTAVMAFSNQQVFEKGGFLGLKCARISIAKFLQKWFLSRDLVEEKGEEKDLSTIQKGGGLSRSTSIRMHMENETIKRSQPQQEETRNSKTEIDPDHIVFGSGIGSLVSHMCYALCQPGYVILIPAPYYSTFQYHVSAVAQCIPHPVFMKDPTVGPSPQDLDEAVRLVEQVRLNFWAG